MTNTNTNFKIENLKTIVTHDGVFHADEVFATALIKLIAKSNNNENKIEVVRTRNPKILQEYLELETSIVIDVGNSEFDHHQELKYNTINGEEVPMSSFGLVHKKFLELDLIMFDKDLQSLVTEIDKADNGVAPSTISTLIRTFTPNWNDKSDTAMEDAFKKAVKFAKGILKNMLEKTNSSLLAEETIKDEIQNLKKQELLYDTKRNYLILQSFIPFQETIIKYNETVSEEDKIKFVINKNKNKYNLHTIKKALGSFENHIDLISLDMAKELGINVDFIHNNKFFAVADSMEALEEIIAISMGEV
jgi:uncharacterized UPF0160 family protein